MIRFAALVTVTLAKLVFRSRLQLLAENLALRQQLVVFKQKRSRPRMSFGDRMFWLFLHRTWRNWANALIVVEPDTVVQWQRQAFKWFWRWVSRAKKVGRRRISREIQELIRGMARDNGWGAPRIHGELLKLGIGIDERTVSRYLPEGRTSGSMSFGVGKDAPESRVVTPQPSASAQVVALPKVGGLQHRYEWREAA